MDYATKIGLIRFLRWLSICPDSVKISELIGNTIFVEVDRQDEWLFYDPKISGAINVLIKCKLKNKDAVVVLIPSIKT